MRIDHLVLTVKDVDKTVDFYTRFMGFEKEVFLEGRVALKFEGGKINLHAYGNEFEPKAENPMPGSADLCFIADEKIEDIMLRFIREGINIIEGPVFRTGSRGRIYSFYFRDPDHNLIEVSNYA
ncbi:MAG: VOC family protein [Pseudomonadales bacterium]|nr:VOC family protein [Pseudomonadales bacterium]